MLPFILLCLAVATYGQSTYSTSTGTQVESENEENANAQPTLYAGPQTSFRSYQPAAQQRRPVYSAPVPRAPDTYSYAPYSFNYVAQGEDGSSTRQETGDASGRVVGSYTLAVEDGRRRVVEYVADQDGFRATIDTNEPGTEIQNPADVVFHSAGLGRANQQAAVAPAPAPRPSTSYRPRPSQIYSQPAVVRPVVYHRDETYSPYRYYDNHAHDSHRGLSSPYYHNDHRGHSASYYQNDHRYYWH